LYAPFAAHRERIDGTTQALGGFVAEQVPEAGTVERRRPMRCLALSLTLAASLALGACSEKTEEAARQTAEAAREDASAAASDVVQDGAKAVGQGAAAVGKAAEKAANAVGEAADDLDDDVTKPSPSPSASGTP
jgi:hypothetical protein